MREPEAERYRPVPVRRRLLILVLAVATAAFVTWAMTRKSGVVREAAKHPADVPACAASQSAGCVGSMTSVIVAPSSAASR
jgi:hypothetical protein